MEEKRKGKGTCEGCVIRPKKGKLESCRHGMGWSIFTVENIKDE